VWLSFYTHDFDLRVFDAQTFPFKERTYTVGEREDEREDERTVRQYVFVRPRFVCLAS
jgi:hypothetical protein